MSKHPASRCEVVTHPAPPTPPHPALFQRAGVRFLGGIGVFSLFTSSGRASLSSPLYSFNSSPLGLPAKGDKVRVSASPSAGFFARRPRFKKTVAVTSLHFQCLCDKWQIFFFLCHTKGAIVAAVSPPMVKLQFTYIVSARDASVIISVG